MIKRKILAPIYLYLLTLSYAVIAFAESFSKKRGELYRLKFFLGIAVVSLSSTISGCHPKSKTTCYEKAAIKDTIQETCYKAVLDTTIEKKKSDTLKKKVRKQNSNTIKKNSTNTQQLNQDSIPPKPVCYGAVGNQK